MYVSQPAVSQVIKQLESALNCALFVRTPKGVTLTAEGRELYAHVSSGLDEIALGEKRVRALTSLEGGEIAIGASDMTLEYYLLPHLEEFHRLHPLVRIAITNGPTPDTLQKLRRNQIDFGAVSEPLPELESGCISTPVRAIEDIFIAAPDRAEFARLTFGELARAPLVMLEKNTSTRAFVDRFLAENGASVSPEFELATSSLIVQFARRGLGIGCVVRDFARQALAEGSVVEVALERPIPKRHICLVGRREAPSRAAAELLSLMLP